MNKTIEKLELNVCLNLNFREYDKNTFRNPHGANGFSVTAVDSGVVKLIPSANTFYVSEDSEIEFVYRQFINGEWKVIN